MYSYFEKPSQPTIVRVSHVWSGGSGGYLKADRGVVLLESLLAVLLGLGGQGHVTEVELGKVISRGGEAGGVGPQVSPLESVLGHTGVGLAELVLTEVPGDESLVAGNGLVLGWQRLLRRS